MFKLNGEPRNLSCFSGKHCDMCENCVLRSRCNAQCRAIHPNCEQRSCQQNCDDCGGGSWRYSGAGMPAICGKAPLLNLYLAQAVKDEYNFTPREFIEQDNRAIPIIQGSRGRQLDDVFPPETTAVAVNLRHVWSGHGWFSQDMRDYLRIPDRIKIILITSVHDDVLDRAWDAEMYDDDLAGLGFDYWQGLEFSQYSYMGFAYNIWQAHRTLASIEASQAHFGSTFPWQALTSYTDPEAYRPWAECSKAVPQLMFNSGDLGNMDKENWKFSFARIRRDVDLLKPRAVWVQNVMSPKTAFYIQRLLPEIACYFMGSAPWLPAFKGRELTLTGNLRVSNAPRAELLLRNQVTYAKYINEAVKSALQGVSNGGREKESKETEIRGGRPQRLQARVVETKEGGQDQAASGGPEKETFEPNGCSDPEAERPQTNGRRRAVIS